MMLCRASKCCPVMFNVPGEHVSGMLLCVYSQCAANTYQLPRIADVVRVFAVVPESVGVPGQRRVDRDRNDLTAQREAARNAQHYTKIHTRCTMHP